MKKLLTTIFLLSAIWSNATNFYVDNTNPGSGAGTIGNPWKTVSQVNSAMGSFNPGDSILFKKGTWARYYGRLTVTRTGTAGNPIYFGTSNSYGTGADPIWQSATPGGSELCLVYFNNRNYLTFYGIHFTDTTIAQNNIDTLARTQYAFVMDGTSNHCVIRKCTVSEIGIGAEVHGSFHWFDSSQFKYLLTVKSTITPDYDDYGANGLVITSSSDNLVTHCLFQRNYARMLDFGLDGGAVEMFGSCSRNKIMYNTMTECGGISEFGSGDGGNSDDNLVAYNKISNSGMLTYINTAGVFAVNVKNLMYFNNVIVFTNNLFGSIYMFNYNGTPAADTVFNLKNNLFYVTAPIAIGKNTSKYKHSNNIFKLPVGSTGFPVGASETSNPTVSLWVSTTGDPITWDYTLVANSLARNFGTSVGLTIDFAGQPIVGLPDAGILEAQSVLPTPPTLDLTQANSLVTLSWTGVVSTIQISSNGTTYTDIGLPTSYSPGVGTWYFRAFDGTSGYSPVRTVTISAPPVTSPVLYINGCGISYVPKKKGSYQLSNIIGQVIQSGNYQKGDSCIRLRRKLLPGIYTLKTTTDGTFKVIVN